MGTVSRDGGAFDSSQFGASVAQLVSYESYINRHCVHRAALQITGRTGGREDGRRCEGKRHKAARKSKRRLGNCHELTEKAGNSLSDWNTAAG
jgi:hypothetical protein